MDKINNVNACPFCCKPNPRILQGYMKQETCEVVNLLHCDSCNYTFKLIIDMDLK